MDLQSLCEMCLRVYLLLPVLSEAPTGVSTQCVLCECVIIGGVYRSLKMLSQ